MKKLVTLESVIEPDADGWQQHTTYAEVHLRTMTHGRLPPRGVTFPDKTYGAVTSSHCDRMTVLLETERDADTIAKLVNIANAEDDADIDAENDCHNSPFTHDMFCNVHYR